jgi:hypothetical protein
VTEREQFRFLPIDAGSQQPADGPSFGEAKPLRLRRIGPAGIAATAGTGSPPRAAAPASTFAAGPPARRRWRSERVQSLIAALLAFLLLGSLAALAIIGAAGLPGAPVVPPRTNLAQEIQGPRVTSPAPTPAAGGGVGERRGGPATAAPVIATAATGAAPAESPGGGGKGGGQTGGGGGQTDGTGDEIGVDQGTGEDATVVGSEVTTGKTAAEEHGKGHAKTQKLGKDQAEDHGKDKASDRGQGKAKGHEKAKGKPHPVGKGKGHDDVIVAGEPPPGQGNGKAKGKDTH